jgi:hypothetical protein
MKLDKKNRASVVTCSTCASVGTTTKTGDSCASAAA